MDSAASADYSNVISDFCCGPCQHLGRSFFPIPDRRHLPIRSRDAKPASPSGHHRPIAVFCGETLRNICYKKSKVAGSFHAHTSRGTSGLPTIYGKKHDFASRGTSNRGVAAAIPIPRFGRRKNNEP